MPNTDENQATGKALHIRFHLRSPVIVSRHMHLDAVIGSVVAGGVWMDDAAFADGMPIAARDGVHRCSAGFWCGVPDRPRVVFGQSITRPRDVAAAMALTDIGPRQRFYRTTFGNRVSMMRQIATDHVDFLALPKPGRIEDLVRYCLALPGLGRKARHGWGEIGGVSIAEHDGDPWILPGTAAPVVSRAVPLSIWREAGIDARHRQDYVAFAPPYHMSTKTVCAIPTDEPLLYDFHGEPA